jgi:hypothetical protein
LPRAAVFPVRCGCMPGSLYGTLKLDPNRMFSAKVSTRFAMYLYTGIPLFTVPPPRSLTRAQCHNVPRRSWIMAVTSLAVLVIRVNHDNDISSRFNASGSRSSGSRRSPCCPGE